MNDVQRKKICYEQVTVETVQNSEIEIVGEIPLTVVGEYRGTVLKKMIQHIELPGFRKGHVPEEMVVQHVGELAILKEVAERAISEAYAQIISDKKLDVVGRPHITITKLAPGNPIGFKIKSAVYPTLELPDYAEIAHAELTQHDDPEQMSVTDHEIDDELVRLQKAIADSQKGSADGGAGEEVVIDDSFAKKLGAFESVADLKEKMKGQLLFDKKQKAYDKRRLAIVDKIIEKTTVVVPDVFIEGELEQMVASFQDRVAHAGVELDVYLKEVGKTIDDLKKEWRVDAEKRAKLQLILNEIAQKEKITPDQDRINREVTHICEHYPDANEHAVHTYVSAQMTNEKVFEFLEGKEVHKEEHVHTDVCEHGHE